MIGTIAIIAMLYPAFVNDPDVELHPMHNISWTLVIVAAFLLHVTRPYQVAGFFGLSRTWSGKLVPCALFFCRYWRLLGC